MTARPRLLLSALVVLASLAGCGGDEQPDASASPQTPRFSLPPPLATPTVTQSPAPAATATIDSPTASTSPESASQGLFTEWQEGDSAGAREFATPEAVAQIFGSPAGDAQFHGCESEGTRFRCSFRYEGGGINMVVQESSDGGFRVEEVLFIAD